jgi:hypothetical protein
LRDRGVTEEIGFLHFALTEKIIVTGEIVAARPRLPPAGGVHHQDGWADQFACPRRHYHPVHAGKPDRRIFGMNVGGLPLVQNVNGFLLSMAIIAASSVVVLWLLKRSGILKH